MVVNAENEKIAHLFLELIETVTTLARRPVVFGKDIFYRRELHSIALIGQSEGITSAELAKFFGITRGVTHKILVQLEKKGFIRKTKQPDNNRDIALYLTESGQKVFALHERYHQELSRDFYSFLATKKPSVRREYINFLQHALNMAKEHL